MLILLYDLLEPCAVKVASTVLRGERISNNPDLPDQGQPVDPVTVPDIHHN